MTHGFASFFFLAHRVSGHWFGFVCVVSYDLWRKQTALLSPTIGSEKWGLSVGGGTEEQCWELGRRLIDESAIIGQLRLN